LVGGKLVVAFRTKEGDGTYESRCGQLLVSIDAGLIGLVAAAPGDDELFGMDEIEFEEPTECWVAGGVIHLGSIAFDTNPPQPDEDAELGMAP
jgi:hypothetical protein